MDKIVFKASLILIIFFCFNMNLLANSDQIQYADGKLFQVDIDVHNRNGICKGTVQSGIEPILGVNSYYKHIVERCANRAEISMKKMKKILIIGKSGHYIYLIIIHFKPLELIYFLNGLLIPRILR